MPTSSRLASMAWVVFATACSGAEPPPPGITTLAADPEPYVRTSARPGATRPAATPAPNAQGTRGDPWPDTAMTPFARAVARVVFAAMEGQPWPADSPLTVGRPDGQPRIEVADGQPPAGALRVLCFYAEVECSFPGTTPTPPAPAPGVPPPPAPGGPAVGNLELGLLLCGTGVRVVEVDEDPGRVHEPLPPGAAGIGRAAAEVLAAFALGRGEELLLRESDRDALGGDPLFQRAMRERLRPDQLARVQQAAARHGQPTGFRLDDMGIVALDAQGPIGLQIDVEHSQGQIVLDGPPFVRVRRFGR